MTEESYELMRDIEFQKELHSKPFTVDEKLLNQMRENMKNYDPSEEFNSIFIKDPYETEIVTYEGMILNKERSLNAKD